jgi:ABC-type phosphate/phosphonate transport system permease subunit
MYLAALVGVVAGLAIVLVHNVWTADWRVLITLLGWINLIRGVASLLLPDKTFALAGGFMASKNMPMAAGVFAALIGLILSYFGYVA